MIKHLEASHLTMTKLSKDGVSKERIEYGKAFLIVVKNLHIKVAQKARTKAENV